MTTVLTRFAALLALGCAGCHLLFGHAPGRGVGLDLAATDVAALDAASDQTSRDRPLPPGDRVIADQPPACLQKNCLECQPLLNPSCTLTCQPECDDLPVERDPWSKCNPVSFSDDFCDPNLSRWSFAMSGLQVSPPGTLRILGNYNTVWVSTELNSGGLLVEARLERFIYQGSSSFALSVDGDTTSALPATSFRMCMLNFSGMTLTLRNELGTGGLSQSKDMPVPFAAQDLVLQSWIDNGVHWCRVVPEKGLPVVAVLPIAGKIDGKALSVGIFSGTSPAPEAQVDWVRAFAP